MSWLIGQVGVAAASIGLGLQYADEQLAGFSEYRLSSHEIALTHTEIGEEFGGRGLARRLVADELADSRRRGLRYGRSALTFAG